MNINKKKKTNTLSVSIIFGFDGNYIYHQKYLIIVHKNTFLLLKFIQRKLFLSHA